MVLVAITPMRRSQPASIEPALNPEPAERHGEAAGERSAS
jgi:hypothetical protein